MANFYVAGVDLGRSPSSWDYQSGGNVRVAGVVKKSILGGFLVAQYQMKGILDNPDESSGVPVYPTADTTVAGFYRVRGGSTEAMPESYRSYWFRYTLELEPALPVAAPRVESRLLGALRTNSHSIAVGTTVPWWAVPDAATMDYVAGATRQTRTTADGDVAVNYTTDGTLLYDATPVWQCPPLSWYVGAARLEVTPDGSNWERLPGLQLGAANPASAVEWRLSNGLVRVSYGGGDGLLKVEHYASGSWSVSKTYRLTVGSTPSTIGAFKTINILRNSPEETTIRLGLDQSTSVPAAITVDLTIRRGALWVEGVVSRTSEIVAYLNNEMGIYRNSAEASTAVTSGVRATSTDAAGGYFWLATSKAKTNDLTQGGFFQNAAASVFDFAVGYGLSGASGANTVTNQVYSYFAAVSETARLARR